MTAATEFLSRYWMAVASHLWQTTIVILVLAGLARAMRRAPARVLNALWCVALIKLVVPVALVAPAVRRALEPLAGRAGAAITRLEAVTVWLEKAGPILDPAASAARSGWGSLGAAGAILLAAWSLGAVWLVAAWLRSRDRSVVRDARSVDELPQEVMARVSEALEGTSIPTGVILVTPERLIPAVVGLFRRRILVSREIISRLAASELRAVLLHEEAHRRRFDSLQVAVQRGAAVAFYYFPLLWPLLARLRETSEMACDEAAIRRGVRPGEYARALARTLDIGLEPLGLAAGLARGTPTLTRRRFERLKHEGRFTPMRWHWACVAIAVLAAMATAVLSAIPPAIAGQTDEVTVEVTAEATTDEDGEPTPSGDEAEPVAERTWTINLVHSVDPEYPKDARKDGAGGTVVLKLTIEGDGTVGDVVTIEEVAAYPSLAEAATEAAGQWTFEILGDVDPETELEVIVPVEFKIDGRKTMTLSTTIPDATEAPEQPEIAEEPEAPEQPEITEEPEAPEEPDVPVEPDGSETVDQPAVPE